MRHCYRYLPLSNEVLNRSLYVTGGGNAFMPPHTPYPPSTHPTHHLFRWSGGRTLQEYQIIYITRGGGVLETATSGPRPLQAGDIFMLFPGEWHRYAPDPEKGWDEHWVAFQGNLAGELIADYPLSVAEPVLHTNTGDLLLREFSRIIDEIQEEDVGHQHILASRTLLILALATASHLRTDFGTPNILEVIREAKAILQEQVDRPVCVETLASTLNVGYSWFRRMFRQYTGLSPAQYHMQLRLNHACELLQTTQLPITTVGERSGFETPQYFSRIFRAKTGQSPRDYRTKVQSRDEPEPSRSASGG
jgi:AraC-like DNA-binding protein